MWRNRITHYVPTDRARFSMPAPAAAASCCAPSAYAAGAFMVPPSAGPQPAIYDLARERALFELRRGKRANYVSRN